MSRLPDLEEVGEGETVTPGRCDGMESRPGVGVQRAAIRAIYPTCWGREGSLFHSENVVQFGGLRKG